MAYAPLINYSTENEYKLHFRSKYCRKPMTTFDGISVRFKNSDFKHAFYKSSKIGQQKKNVFSIKRAQRIDWIGKVLLDKNAELHIGWDNKKKVINSNRRVAVVNGDYAVVIQQIRSSHSIFITAFIADAITIRKIINMPRWQ